jgi:hypothetical protein
MLQPLYPHKSPRYPSDRTLGPKASLDVAEETKIPPLLENDHSRSVHTQPLRYHVKLLMYAIAEREL